MTDITIPEIGSVWKEIDKRFERYVQVMEIKDGKARIANCSANSNWHSGRSTWTKISRFGKAYKRVEVTK